MEVILLYFLSWREGGKGAGGQEIASWQVAWFCIDYFLFFTYGERLMLTTHGIKRETHKGYIQKSPCLVLL